MKKIYITFFTLIVLLTLSACSSDIPFTITNPTKETILVSIDDKQFSIGAGLVQRITLSSGPHKMVTDRLGVFEFMVYATMKKGGVINPSMQDYILVNQPYRNTGGVDEKKKTQFVFESLAENIKKNPNYKNNTSFKYYTKQLFIDDAWSYEVDEELPAIIQKEGIIKQKINNEFKLFSVDDFIEHAGEEFYQTHFRPALELIEIEKKHYSEKELLTLIYNIETDVHSEAHQPIIDVIKKYLKASTVKEQIKLGKALHKMKGPLFSNSNPSNKKEHALRLRVIDLTTQVYTSARVMNVSGANDLTSNATVTLRSESVAESGGTSTLQYIGYGVIILLALLILVVLPIVVYKLLSSDEIKWQDEDSFDNTLRNFALTAASVYNSSSRIDAYKNISDENKIDGQDSLQSAWTTTNKQELLSTLESLRTNTHRADQTGLADYVNTLNKEEFKQFLEGLDNDDRGQAKLVYRKPEYSARSFMAWDLLRYFFIAHTGVLAGYITIEEFDEISLPVITTVQNNYNSWEDFFEQFLLGRMMWKSGENDLSVKLFKTRVKSLLTKENSPCKKVKWDCQNNTEETSPSVMSDDAFWLIIDASNRQDITAFLPLVEVQLNALSDDDLLRFDTKIAYMTETFRNPVYQYGAAILLPEEVSRYNLLVWLIYQGRESYEMSLQKPDDVFTQVAKKFITEHRKNDLFIATLDESLSLFSIVNSIAETRQLNLLFRSYTYEERSAIYNQSCKVMPASENVYPQLTKEVSSWV